MTQPEKRDGDPQDPLQELLAQLLNGQNVDPQDLSQLTQNLDPQQMQQMLSHLQGMMSGFLGDDEGPVNWKITEQATHQVAGAQDPAITAESNREVDEALRLAELWLDPFTDLPSTGLLGKAWTRTQWVDETLGTWKQLTEPVATSIARAISTSMEEQVPEDAQGLLGGAASLMQNIGGSIFGMQLGQAIGGLSQEVVSSTDIGIPLADLQMALLPTNIVAFSEGLELPEGDVRLYLALREAAHARLFTQVPWLRNHILSAIEAFARGIHVDPERFESLASNFDPAHPEELQAALSRGDFLPEHTPEQNAAMDKLETILALIEGWVDELSYEAAAQLPSAAALRETIRRRRATGGPAEHAFGSLVGLELRPRKLREAAQLWRSITEQQGIAARDALWRHPDVLPTSEDLEDPKNFTERRALAAKADAQVDAEIQKLLAEGNENSGKSSEDSGDSPPENRDTP